MTWRRLREGIGALAILTSGCEVTEVDLTETGTASIPRDHTIGPIEMPEFENIDLLLAVVDNPGVGPEDITHAVVNSLRVEVISPDTADLDFAERAEVFAESPGMERVRVAHLDEFPPGARVVDFEIDDVDLSDYVTSRLVTIRAEIDGRPPERDVQIAATAKLSVGVTLRGVCEAMKKK